MNDLHDLTLRFVEDEAGKEGKGHEGHENDNGKLFYSSWKYSLQGANKYKVAFVR